MKNNLITSCLEISTLSHSFLSWDTGDMYIKLSTKHFQVILIETCDQSDNMKTAMSLSLLSPSSGGEEQKGSQYLGRRGTDSCLSKSLFHGHDATWQNQQKSRLVTALHSYAPKHQVKETFWKSSVLTRKMLLLVWLEGWNREKDVYRFNHLNVDILTVEVVSGPWVDIIV